MVNVSAMRTLQQAGSLSNHDDDRPGVIAFYAARTDIAGYFFRGTMLENSIVTLPIRFVLACPRSCFRSCRNCRLPVLQGLEFLLARLPSQPKSARIRCANAALLRIWIEHGRRGDAHARARLTPAWPRAPASRALHHHAGGYASFVRDPQRSVHGVLWELALSDVRCSTAMRTWPAAFTENSAACFCAPPAAAPARSSMSADRRRA